MLSRRRVFAITKRYLLRTYNTWAVRLTLSILIISMLFMQVASSQKKQYGFLAQNTYLGGRIIALMILLIGILFWLVYYVAANRHYFQDILLKRMAYCENGVLKEKESNGHVLIITLRVQGGTQQYRVYGPLMNLFYSYPNGSTLSFHYLQRSGIVCTDGNSAERTAVVSGIEDVCNCNPLYRQLDSSKKQRYYQAAMAVIREWALPVPILCSIVVQFFIPIALFGYGFDLAGKIAIPVDFLVSLWLVYRYVADSAKSLLAGLTAYPVSSMSEPTLQAGIMADFTEHIPKEHKRRAYLSIETSGKTRNFQYMKSNRPLQEKLASHPEETPRIGLTAYAIAYFASSILTADKPIDILLDVEESV